jgi:hypothetical protein
MQLHPPLAATLTGSTLSTMIPPTMLVPEPTPPPTQSMHPTTLTEPPEPPVQNSTRTTSLLWGDLVTMSCIHASKTWEEVENIERLIKRGYHPP